MTRTGWAKVEAAQGVLRTYLSLSQLDFMSCVGSAMTQAAQDAVESIPVSQPAA